MGGPFLDLRRTSDTSDGTRWRTIVAFAAGLCVATATLVWLGYVTTREWRHGINLLLERRQTEALGLVGTALNRDMKGVWTTVIVPINPVTIEEDPPYDLLQLTAKAFARFPYPESFIIWKESEDADGLTYVFTRTDRRAHWETDNVGDEPFPVSLVRDPLPLRHIVATIRAQASSGNSFTLLKANIDGVPYQVVAHLMFDAAKPHRLVGMAAFTVNLSWVRQEYFRPLLAQVARIGGYEDTLSLAVVDDGGRTIATTGSPLPNTADLKRPFAMSFLDSASIATSSVSAQRAVVPEWSVHVRPSSDNALFAALQGTHRMFLLMALAAAISMSALLVTLRAIRASAKLASMKSEFVSTVTHELKTPLSFIRLLGDTLASRRYTSADTIQQYAALLSQESSRLAHSIDNLLTYARYTSRERPAAMTPTDVGDLVENALGCFLPILEGKGFQLQLDVPRDLPHILTDRQAMIQVIENVIDNAIKYSGETRALKIDARASGKYVRLSFTDRGIGIPKEDLRHVFKRFYRGSNTSESGSGLGLAIARRILDAHDGEIDVRSTLNVGTTVDLLLMIARQP